MKLVSPTRVQWRNERRCREVVTLKGVKTPIAGSNRGLAHCTCVRPDPGLFGPLCCSVDGPPSTTRPTFYYLLLLGLTFY